MCGPVAGDDRRSDRTFGSCHRAFAKCPPMAHQLDASIADVAVNRHGRISRDDLVRLGATRHAVAWRKERGDLEERSPLVFRLRGTVDTPKQRLLAAVIDAGRTAVATRRSGAALYG